MLILYRISIKAYYFGIWLASFFNPKARLWIEGRRKQKLVTLNESIWFHFASLGEFEQGRPVLEKLKAENPAVKTVVTFFSPSGYEIRKNTPLADYVYYLPLDTRRNAKLFISTIKPKIAIFTKYEYWYFYMDELYQREIPLYLISAIYRPQQIFFRSYGGFYRNMLLLTQHFFVQDEVSKKLLADINIDEATVSGDTRFDRVWENAQTVKPLETIAAFKGESKVFIAGSTWPTDEDLITNLILIYPKWKFIIAPHEISKEKISNLLEKLPAEKTVRYSEIPTDSNLLHQKQVLVIDNIGLLSRLYQYGTIAYIGGGFGAGIHNTLEAAAFGLPVIFGPIYQKFKEAQDLITLNAGFSIVNEASLENIVYQLINDDNFYFRASANAKNYTQQNTGATNKIINYIRSHQTF
ncbi:3-deoxy-D-manno-octulosonic acid transferase [Mucilaginibacter arboris]|uniref:3-deoxy-D-manno-octulosonic acid transferase n=1 Tax=Mucilaginibacter arboris TaxID=2682090 RepID=A0A7K1T0Z6_9SPHI|nr:glycosyltransferase N-terminal domain-containing protein [Mucilaginibacter arboris]MVN23219.1 3-deoxy-D-manno-octulosonic acid transferase [Mucilaginibacter arboris]